MIKTIIMFLGIALVGSFLFATSAMAWRCGVGRGMGGYGWGCGMGQGICWSYGVPNLTTEQSAKLTDFQKNFIAETSNLRSELTVKRIELDQLLIQPKPNPEEVMTKQKELTELQSKLQQKCLNKQLEMRKILTEDQLSQIPYGFGPNTSFSPGWMRGYVPPQGQGFGPGRGRAWGNRGGYGPCWW